MRWLGKLWVCWRRAPERGSIGRPGFRPDAVHFGEGRLALPAVIHLVFTPIPIVTMAQERLQVRHPRPLTLRSRVRPSRRARTGS